MCGIVGVAGDITPKVRDRVFRDLLDVGQLRGRHSTGVIKVQKDLEYTWVKQVGPPSVLCDGRTYEDVVEKGEAAALVGHCRYRTVGDVSTKTAHPFDYPKEGIVGVHNGTLTKVHELDTYKYNKVDSEVLFGHLALNGAEETFRRIMGAWACVWWDDQTKTLNFIRNSARELWFTWSKDLRRMYWASENWMLYAAHRMDELWMPEEGSRFMLQPEDTLWRFSINAGAKGEEKVLTLKQPIVIPHKKEEVRSYAGNPHSGFTKKPDGDGWEMKNGVWTRTVISKEGGEGTNPFQQGATREEREKQQEQARKELEKPYGSGPLNDPLPTMMLPPPGEPTQVDGKNTNLSKVPFLNTSCNSSDSQTDSSSSKKSTKKKLSLPSKSSNVVPLRTNEKNSNESKSSMNTSPAKGRITKKVSLRTVKGCGDYITDNKTGKEFSETEFEKNTDGKCWWCKAPIGSLEEVAEFITEEKFLCKNGCGEEEFNEFEEMVVNQFK
jgi:hypothetical protein